MVDWVIVAGGSNSSWGGGKLSSLGLTLLQLLITSCSKGIWH